MAGHGGTLCKYSMWKAVHRRTGRGAEAGLCYAAALSKAKFVEQHHSIQSSAAQKAREADARFNKCDALLAGKCYTNTDSLYKD